MFLLIITNACENEKNPIVIANGLQVRTQESTTNFVLAPQDNANTVLTFLWTKTDNGIDSSESDYILEISKSGTSFSNSLQVNSNNFILNERKYILKVQELNDLLSTSTDFSCGVAQNLDIRVKSIFGTKNGNPFIQYSNVLTFKVTPYSNETPILSFVKNVGDIASTPKLASLGVLNSDYEGYTYLTPGNYKFYKPNSCGDFTTPTVFGGSGSLAGTLSTTSSGIDIQNTGYYFIKADLAANTYSIKEYRTFGVFGSATRAFGFGNAIPMTDTNNKNIWKLTVPLIKGKLFRFKSNLWTGSATIPDPVNFGTVELPNFVQFPPFVPTGPSVANPTPTTTTTTINILGKNSVPGKVVEVTGIDGEIAVSGTFTNASDRQKYDIVLDVSKPRNYTYTITPNNN